MSSRPDDATENLDPSNGDDARDNTVGTFDPQTWRSLAGYTSGEAREADQSENGASAEADPLDGSDDDGGGARNGPISTSDDDDGRPGSSHCHWQSDQELKELQAELEHLMRRKQVQTVVKQYYEEKNAKQAEQVEEHKKQLKTSRAQLRAEKRRMEKLKKKAENQKKTAEAGKHKKR